MTSFAMAPALAERTDIHKSCKSIETLLNVLNEYCEVASAVVSLQKKLAKALRDTASLKVTTDIAANAMNASANIFEALSDIDSKFSKIADKEYDSVSSEIKKWFKKLAKEEKAHDERMANANARIKQAGQAYEKKSKKKVIDAAEEHARYINLISTLGPEVSQEKYNHTLTVTQKHTTTTYSVAACLSRLADTEWQRSCECVRRFSPTVGPLGQWRSLCEGGWTGQDPPNLPDLDGANDQQNQPADIESTEREPAGLKTIGEEPRQPLQNQVVPAQFIPETRERVTPSSYSIALPSASESSNDISRDQISARNSLTFTRQQQLESAISPTAPIEAGPAPQPQPSSLEPPILPYVDQNTGSVRSLSAFPSPPTHFPLPPPRQPRSQQTSYFQQFPSSSNLELPSSSQQPPESPLSSNGDLSGVSDVEEPMSRPTIQSLRDLPSSATTSTQPSPETKFKTPKIPEEKTNNEQPNKQEVQRPIPVRSQTALTVDSIIGTESPNESRHVPSLSIGSSPQTSSKPYNRNGHEQDTPEFGILNRDLDMPANSKMADNSKYQRPLERADTGVSSGSIVAAMRNRYSNTSESMSPPARDVHRLPLSVNDLASRYQPTDAPLSPRTRTGSPPVTRQQSLPLLDTAARQTQETYNSRVPVQPGPSPESDRKWPQRNEDPNVLERNTKEQELRARERELEMRARELDRERARLQTLREDERGEEKAGYREAGPSTSEMGQFGLRPRERRISLRQQTQGLPSRNDLAVNVSDARLGQAQYSQSQTHLGLPPSPRIHAFPSSPQRSPKLADRSQLPNPPQSDPQHESRNRDRYPSNNGRSSNTNSTSNSAHAPYCGCESCSVSKYKNSGPSSPVQQYRQQSPQETSPQLQSQRSEKSSKLGVGWMRRLSMPVGNAFSGADSKRHQSNNSTSSTSSQYALGNGIGNTPTSGTRGFFSMDSKKNASTTALSPTAYSNDRGLAVQEDGRYRQGMGRRSLEASGISNRSMTNFGILGRQ